MLNLQELKEKIWQQKGLIFGQLLIFGLVSLILFNKHCYNEFKQIIDFINYNTSFSATQILITGKVVFDFSQLTNIFTIVVLSAVVAVMVLIFLLILTILFNKIATKISEGINQKGITKGKIRTPVHSYITLSKIRC